MREDVANHYGPCIDMNVNGGEKYIREKGQIFRPSSIERKIFKTPAHSRSLRDPNHRHSAVSDAPFRDTAADVRVGQASGSFTIDRGCRVGALGVKKRGAKKRCKGASTGFAVPRCSPGLNLTIPREGLNWRWDFTRMVRGGLPCTAFGWASDVAARLWIHPQNRPTASFLRTLLSNALNRALQSLDEIVCVLALDVGPQGVIDGKSPYPVSQSAVARPLQYSLRGWTLQLVSGIRVRFLQFVPEAFVLLYLHSEDSVHTAVTCRRGGAESASEGWTMMAAR
ncbi:uncharacterized protein EV420DRAFT_1487713 [Desarmillaria tabescens]|uniref:Uncharacterized protein n=1 Tax=Armillaria tabescens TaxID=1929756 RepID=A0AA39MJJ4_ARMTA|nr:uncharacterized protein EV420DRAFT_1487713 [Desarmillaria tabescens]KAK0436039.1 hypothetical protein EV420DRAFT_1487713 [Desarmillaria tabescens]